MKELWFAFWNERSTATLVLRAAALGTALYFLAPMDEFRTYLLAALGGGSLLLPAGQPNRQS